MARYIYSGDLKYIGGDDAPIGFEKGLDGRYHAEIGGRTYKLEKCYRNIEDGVHTTGWYLFGEGHSGSWCGRLILGAVVAANEILISRNH